MMMDSDSDSSDDEILKPNGFVDVRADLVNIVSDSEPEDQVDVKLKNEVNSQKKKRKRGRGCGSATNSFDSSCSFNSPCPIAVDESIVFLDEEPDDSGNSFSGDYTGGTRKSRRIASKKSSFSAESNSFDIEVATEKINDSLLDDSDLNLTLDQEASDIVPEAKEDPNIEVKVRVQWKQCNFASFNLRKFQKLQEIYTHYARLEGVEEERILFTLRDKPVTPNDTPAVLNIGLSFLEGGIIDVSNISSKTAANEDDQDGNPNALKLFIQRQGVREKHTVFTYPHEKISVLISKLSEDLKIPTSSIKLMLDGDPMDNDCTPEDYDLDQGDCIDLVMS